MKKLKNIILFLIISLVSLTCFHGCGTTTKVPITNNSNINFKDSLVIRESTRWVDSIIYVEIPREKVMEIISQIDTSYLQTSVAKSTAYIDTNSLMIIHSLENKDTVLSEKIIYKDRYITETKVVYRDSIVTKEIPVEVQVEKKIYPKTYWWLLGFFVIVVGIFAVRIYFKIKK